MSNKYSKKIQKKTRTFQAKHLILRHRQIRAIRRGGHAGRGAVGHGRHHVADVRGAQRLLSLAICHHVYIKIIIQLHC